MALKVTVSMNMCNAEAQRLEMARNQDRAMTLQRVLFCTHQGKAIFLAAFLDAIQALAKQILAGQTVVLHSTLVIAGGIVTAAAEFATEKNIGNADKA